MSLSRVIGSSRLARAKKISKNSVREFQLISEEPLICFAVIQGSSSTPYVVVIDLDENEVIHSCPDYNTRREYCKHVAKLVLLLSDDIQKKFVEKRPRISTSDVNTKLRVLKSQIIQSKVDETDDTELNINDATIYYIENPNTKLLEKIVNFIKNNIEKSNILTFINKLNYFINIPMTENKLFLMNLSPYFKKEFILNLDKLIDRLRSNNVIRNLEYAYLYSGVAKQMGYKIPYYSPDYIKDMSNKELGYTTVFFEILYQNISINFNKYLTFIKTLSSNTHTTFSYTKDMEYIFESIKRKINFGDTSVVELKRWINNKLKQIAVKTFSYNFIDDFLIYLIRSNKETVDLKISFYNDVSFFSMKKLEDSPATKFAISEIMESEREYLTKSEFHSHPKFFAWLNSRDNGGNWIEKPRIRVSDVLLNTEGLIVQWKLNIGKVFNDKYYAMDGNKRLILPYNNPIVKNIQPFDYSYCDPVTRPKSDYVNQVQANYILVPDQIVNLVQQGVNIISNLLPWNILSNFAKTGYLLGGDVSIAIQYCENHSFIYGSIALKNALKRIIKLGNTGISDKVYLEIYNLLKIDTGRLNTTSRPLAKKIIAAEGESLGKIIKLLSLSQTAFLGIIVKTVKESPSLNTFRTRIITYVIGELHYHPKLWMDFIRLNSDDLGHYLGINQNFRKMIFNHARKLEILLNKKVINRQFIFKQPLGKVICDFMNIKSSNQITEFEIQEIKKVLISISDTN